MNIATIAPALVAWLATYIIHSTAMLLATALITTRIRSELWRDSLWKIALVGGIITATAQVALNVQPIGGRMSVVAEARDGEAGTAPASPRSAPSALPVGERNSTPEAASASVTQPAPRSASASSAATAAATPDARSARTVVETQPMFAPSALRNLTIGWVAIAVLLLVRLAYRHVRLFRMLSDRRQVVEGGLAEMLAELRRNAGMWRPVWLAASAHCPTPLALGSSEICIPDRFVDELQQDEQRAALAHELAHIARLDPLWHLVAGVIESVFFFQPLNRLARLRMREAAEHLCDDWALDHGGSEIGLARCLAAVASWITPGAQPIPSGTMAMAEGGSPLLVRVERLLQRRPRARNAPFAVRAATAAGLLITLVASAPIVVARQLTLAASPMVEPHVDSTASPEIPAIVHNESLPDAVATAPHQAPTPTPHAVIPESVVVVRSAVSGSLEHRWDVARADAARKGDRSYWIAWAVPSVVPRGDMLYQDTRGWTNRDMDSPPVAATLGIEDDMSRLADNLSAAVVLFKLYITADGITQVERIATRGPAIGLHFGAPVYWIGTPDVSDSRQWLTALLEGIGKRELPRAIVAAIAVHRDNEVVRWLNSVIDDDRRQYLHTEAIEGLAWHPSPATLARLTDLARNGSTPEMQREAVESIGRLDYPGAAAQLRTLMREVRDPATRRQVAESMGDRPDAETLRALMDAAVTDSDGNVRRQAAEAIGKLHPKDAMVGLRQLIFNSDDAGVRREAVEALGDVGTREAFELLKKIVQDHDDPGVVVEAVETLGAMPSEWARSALIQIARNHPMAEARSKANEELGNLAGRDR